MSGDIEGARCDECGGVVGPNGCCYTAKKVSTEIRELRKRNDELQKENSRLALLKQELDDALAKSLSLQNHYAHLLNVWDAGQRMAFASNQEWIDRLKEVK